MRSLNRVIIVGARSGSVILADNSLDSMVFARSRGDGSLSAAVRKRKFLSPPPKVLDSTRRRRRRSSAQPARKRYFSRRRGEESLRTVSWPFNQKPWTNELFNERERRGGRLFSKSEEACIGRRATVD